MAFKLCVVGCGGIANAMHGPAYLKYAAQNREAVFTGCCDVDAAKAEVFKARFGFLHAYTDMEEMLSREKPDAVCLISPVHLTAKLAAKVLERGIPLLLEKPPGATREETLRLMDIASKTGVPNQVAFNRRYAPLVRELKKTLDAGHQPSQIRSVGYDMFRVNRLDDDFSTTAIHAIDTARFIAGSDYRHVDFTYRPYPGLGEHVSDVYMSCEMKSGAMVRIAICPVTGIIVERAQVILHDNTMFLDLLGNALSQVGRLVSVSKNEIIRDLAGDGSPDGGEAFESEGFYYENKSFFDDIIAGRKPTGDLRTALQSVEVAECIRKRAEEYAAE